MDKKVILWIVLGILILIALFQTFQISTISKFVATGSSNTAGAATSAGTANIPSSAPSGGGMVGGC